MGLFFKVISYIFHPLFVPIAGTISYFMITPKYSPLEFQSGNILPIFILTVIIPIISFLILKNLGIVTSIFIPSIKERKYPFYVSIALLLMVLLKVIPNNYTPELYYYFLGLITATSASLLLLFLDFKSSMHMMGLGSLLMFLICLSIHFEINIIMAISFFTLIAGVLATARLYLKAHSTPEVLIGFLLGLISQLLTIQFWL
ncbi:MAG: phosphatase PAP2 family protein [Bacteroidota bacterium]